MQNVFLTAENGLKKAGAQHGAHAHTLAWMTAPCLLLSLQPQKSPLRPPPQGCPGFPFHGDSSCDDKRFRAAPPTPGRPPSSHRQGTVLLPRKVKASHPLAAQGHLPLLPHQFHVLHRCISLAYKQAMVIIKTYLPSFHHGFWVLVHISAPLYSKTPPKVSLPANSVSPLSFCLHPPGQSSAPTPAPRSCSHQSRQQPAPYHPCRLVLILHLLDPCLFSLRYFLSAGFWDSTFPWCPISPAGPASWMWDLCVSRATDAHRAPSFIHLLLPH